MRQALGSRAGAALGALLLLALAIVVVSATGAGPGGPAAPEQGALAATALVRAAAILSLIAALGLGLLITWSLWGVGRRRDVGDRSSLRAYMLVTLLQACLVILLLWLRPELQRALTRHLPGQPGAAGAPPPLPGSAPSGTLPAGVDWLTAAIVAIVLAAAAYLLLRGAALRPRRRRREAAREAVQAAVDESLADFEEEDLRRAVIRAYARMEAALARAGLARRPSETSLEYMARALAWLGAPSSHVARLTELFNLARFSPHPVGGEMKAQALAALHGLRGELQAGPPARRP